MTILKGIFETFFWRSEMTMKRVKVVALYGVPVKGAEMQAVNSHILTPDGAAYSHGWAVVRGSEVMRPDKLPGLLTLRSRVVRIGHSNRIALQLGMIGHGDWRTDVDPGRGEPEEFEIRFPGATKKVWGVPVGAGADRWLCDVFCCDDLRLVRLLPGAPREFKCDPAGATVPMTNFADSAPLHLISRASLRELMRNMQRQPASLLILELMMRPTMVVDGEDLQPFEEDRWGTLRCLGATGECILYDLDFPRLTDRCAVTLMDPISGRTGAYDTLAALQRMTRMMHIFIEDLTSREGLCFGIYGRLRCPISRGHADASEPCEHALKVGDWLQVTALRSPAAI